MQKKIRQLAEGKIFPAKGELTFSEPRIALEARASGTVSGEFYVNCSDSRRIRGAVFSNEPRMECLTEGFDGEEPCIRYQFNSKGLSQGETVSGRFTVISDAGEAHLPFCVTVCGIKADTSVGSVSTISDFLRLYEESPKEAFKLFYSSQFPALLTNVQQKLYYKGFMSASAGFVAIEEFLVASSLKEPVDIRVSFPYEDEVLLSEEREEILTVERVGRGYLRAEISSNSPAVSFSRTTLSADDFIGAVSEAKVRLDPALLHPGKNLIEIKVFAGSIERTISFSMRAMPLSPVHHIHMDAQKIKAALTKDYIDYRLKLMMTGEWAARTLRNLDSLIARGESAAWYNLMKAQVYIANRQKQEALFILRDFKNERAGRDTCIWAYYLYLSTLVEKERGYVEKLTAEIENIFKHNPEDERLFWMLLFLRPDYQRDNGKKFAAIRHWIQNSHASPFLFVEAYHLIWQNPALLSGMDDFNLSLISWAIRHGALSRDIVIQLMNLVNVDRDYSKKAYRLLSESYEKFPSEELLRCIVSYVVRSGQRDPEFVSILKKGIMSGLSVTGIYEAYLSSMDSRDVREIPRSLAMYFGFDHGLSDELKELLFANVILNKASEPEIYDQYGRTMEMFAMNAMQQGRINDNLAIIYGDLVDKNLINDDIARNLSGILLSRRLTVVDKEASVAIIYQEAFNDPVLAPVKDGCCYFDLTCENFVILIQDKSGYRYALKNPLCEKLFESGESADKIFDLCPGSISYAVKNVETARKSGFSAKDSAFVGTVLASGELSKDYIYIVLPLWLHYLSDNLQDDAVESMLRGDIDLAKLAAADRGFIIGLMIDYHMDDAAFAAVRDYGTDHIPVSKLILLTSYMIERGDMDFDEDLYSISRLLFAKGAHNTIIASYLAMHFAGAVEEMLDLYDIAKSYDLDVADLTERLLTFMLFSGQICDRRMEIFDDYFEGHPSAVLVEAFLTVECHAILTKDMVPEYRLLTYLMGFRDQPLNDACRIGMLKLISQRDELDDVELDTADKILFRLLNTGRCFAFFKDLDYSLISHYHLYDKTVAEYRGEAGRSVLINYEQDGTMVEEEMTESYPGIYTKQFVLFFGEEKEYFVTIREEDGDLSEPPVKLRSRDVIDRPVLNRFEKLNRMSMDITLDNRDALAEEVEEYSELDNVVNTLFSVI